MIKAKLRAQVISFHDQNPNYCFNHRNGHRVAQSSDNPDPLGVNLYKSDN